MDLMICLFLEFKFFPLKKERKKKQLFVEKIFQSWKTAEMWLATERS